jgi:hypothetical protein
MGRGERHGGVAEKRQRSRLILSDIELSSFLTACRSRSGVITMPGRPSDPLPLNKISLELYRDTILKSIDKERHPVVLVGHSFAGMTI